MIEKNLLDERCDKCGTIRRDLEYGRPKHLCLKCLRIMELFENIRNKEKRLGRPEHTGGNNLEGPFEVH